MQLPTEQQLTEMTIAHWREHCPQMYAGLVESKQLHQSARNAAQWTLDAANKLIRGGMSVLEAWAMTRHEFCLILAEDELEMEYGEEEPEPETEEYGWIPLARSQPSPVAAAPATTT